MPLPLPGSGLGMGSMKAIVYLIALVVGASQIAADPVRAPAHPARPKSKTVDLDLTLDFDIAEGDPEPEPRAQGSEGKTKSNAWIYMAVGATAAAGGVGWYLYDTRAKSSAPVRNEQVFTDER
jgi:hypothetical protein